MSFVVTAYNEEKHIRDTVATIKTAASGRFSDYEILIVDDGSADATGAIIDEMARENRSVMAIHNERNLGLGGAYKRGIAKARNEYLMWVSGDNAESGENIRNIIGRIGEADIIVPYLVNQKNRPLFRRLTSRTFVLVMNLLFGLKVKYYNGAVVHRTELIRSIEITTNSFAYQAEALLKLIRAGHSYVEVGYESTTYSGLFSNALKPRNLIEVVRTILSLFFTERLGAGGGK